MSIPEGDQLRPGHAVRHACDGGLVGLAREVLALGNGIDRALLDRELALARRRQDLPPGILAGEVGRHPGLEPGVRLAVARRDELFQRIVQNMARDLPGIGDRRGLLPLIPLHGHRKAGIGHVVPGSTARKQQDRERRRPRNRRFLHPDSSSICRSRRIGWVFEISIPCGTGVLPGDCVFADGPVEPGGQRRQARAAQGHERLGGPLAELLGPQAGAVADAIDGAENDIRLFQHPVEPRRAVLDAAVVMAERTRWISRSGRGNAGPPPRAPRHRRSGGRRGRSPALPPPRRSRTA